MAFTPEQLVLLDNLIYEAASIDKQFKTVGKIVETLLANGSYDKTAYQALIGIQNDPYLMNLTVGNQINTGDDKDGTGFRAATFTDNSGNTAVIFRGTTGDYQWMDNATTGYKQLSNSQQEALDYMASLKEIDGNDVVTSGHSKGGNMNKIAA